MAQIGDGITYVGDGNNGTTAGVPYTGTLVRLNAPGGWGPSDISIIIGGTPTTILNTLRDPMNVAFSLDSGTQQNGTWRAIV